MTNTEISSAQPGDGIARITELYGSPYGQPRPCVACDQAVDVDGGYLALWAPSHRRPGLYGVAHHARWVGPGDDDYDHACPDRLRSLWDRRLERAGVARLTVRDEAGGQRFYAGDVALHAGTALDVLTAQDQWLGRFEYQCRPGRWTPLLYVVPAGYNPPAQPYHLDVDIIVRIPNRHDR